MRNIENKREIVQVSVVETKRESYKLKNASWKDLKAILSLAGPYKWRIMRKFCFKIFSGFFFLIFWVFFSIKKFFSVKIYSRKVKKIQKKSSKLFKNSKKLKKQFYSWHLISRHQQLNFPLPSTSSGQIDRWMGRIESWSTGSRW